MTWFVWIIAALVLVAVALMATFPPPWSERPDPRYIVTTSGEEYTRRAYVDTIQRALVADFYGTCTYGTQRNAEAIYVITHGNNLGRSPRDLTLSERRIAGLVYTICEHAADYSGTYGWGPVLPLDERPAEPFPADPQPDRWFLDEANGVAVE